MTSIYTPNNWQLVHVIPKDTSAAYYRILAGWSGSFIYGNSWKLSSGCEQVIDEGDSWRVPQSSGSVYILSKNSEKPSVATVGVLKSVMQQNTDVVLEVISMKDFVQNLI